MTARLRPFFSYYGSKHRIIDKYPAPVHGRIVEPFAGSAAYATRYYWLPVTLYDANPKITGSNFGLKGHKTEAVWISHGSQTDLFV
jgi:hypothetical protein